jgi:catechol 2,3-dioxygenase-like lactoylglutathione lyase family enzyme
MADRLAELGQTPGVYICAPCALWAARRAGPLSALSRVPVALRRIRSHLRRHRATGDAAVQGTTPILASTDLDRTTAFFATVGFTPEERSEQYLVLGSGDAELHFALHDTATRGQCLVVVVDALALWKRLREQGISGVGNVADREHGLRDFTLVDPDGNHVRFGSPIPHE